MADPFVAEIRILPFTFAPRGWAFCNGQVMPIAQNTALFALLGTTYGGNGMTTFALPDLRGSLPLGTGQGPGLSPRELGEFGGAAAVTLLAQQMPLHGHGLRATAAATSASPAGAAMAPVLAGTTPLASYRAPGTLVAMAADAVAPAGGGQPHNNLSPYLALHFVIALQGIFPPRS